MYVMWIVTIAGEVMKAWGRLQYRSQEAAQAAEGGMPEGLQQYGRPIL